MPDSQQRNAAQRSATQRSTVQCSAVHYSVDSGWDDNRRITRLRGYIEDGHPQLQAITSTRRNRQKECPVHEVDIRNWNVPF